MIVLHSAEVVQLYPQDTDELFLLAHDKVPDSIPTTTGAYPGHIVHSESNHTPAVIVPGKDHLAFLLI